MAMNTKTLKALNLEAETHFHEQRRTLNIELRIRRSGLRIPPVLINKTLSKQKNVPVVTVRFPSQCDLDTLAAV